MFRFLFTVSFASALLFAQTSAEITGRITDASKAVVPGATVTATNIDRRTARTTISNDQGYFILPSIDKGNYEVTVQASGFKPVTQTGLKLDVNQSLRLDFSLEIGAVAEKIQVVGNIPLLEVNTAQLGTVVT